MKIAKPAMKRNETNTETTAKHKRQKRKKETEKKNATNVERRENYLSLNNLKYGGVSGHIWLPHTHTHTHTTDGCR